MAQTRTRYSSQMNNRRYSGRANGDAYVYGNTVRKMDIQRQLEEEPRKQLSNEARKNREKAQHMSLGYVAFLMAGMIASAVILINYIQLQADLTTKVKQVARLESQLNSIKLANDEEYNRVTSSIDLEEIKRIAIGELGMTYAQEGQIVFYSNEGNDYMRRATTGSN